MFLPQSLPTLPGIRTRVGFRLRALLPDGRRAGAR